jgi:hypothetical protein
VPKGEAEPNNCFRLNGSRQCGEQTCGRSSEVGIDALECEKSQTRAGDSTATGTERSDDRMALGCRLRLEEGHRRTPIGLRILLRTINRTIVTVYQVRSRYC